MTRIILIEQGKAHETKTKTKPKTKPKPKPKPDR